MREEESGAERAMIPNAVTASGTPSVGLPED